MLGLHRLDEDPASGPGEAPASGLGEVPASGLVGGEEQQCFLLQYTWHSSNPWIQIESETEFLTRLARQAAVVWDMFRLTNLQVGLGSRRVTAREKIDHAALVATHKQHLAQQAAMRAFKLAAGLGRSSTGRSGRRKGSGRAAGGRGGVARSSGRGRAKNVMQDGASSASDMSSQEHCGAETEKPQCENIGGSLLGRCPRAAPGERSLELWGGGRFAFAEIRPKGIHIGYGVTCGLRVNADGYSAGTPQESNYW